MEPKPTRAPTHLAVAVLLLAACEHDPPAGPPDAARGWSRPTCDEILGTAAVTYTADEGATLVRTREALQGIAYTYGLVALEAPDTLVAEHRGEILRSQDAGCSWSVIGTVPTSILTLVAGRGARAYAFKDNDQPMYRVDGEVISKLGVAAPGVVGLGVDPADHDHLRAGDSDGNLWDSRDAGATWTRTGMQVPATPPLLGYRFAFDPADLDHALFGLASEGAFVTSDGGASWSAVTGLAANGRANVFSIVIAGAGGGQVVWAQGIDLADTNVPVYAGRNIWRSTDGGRAFTSVVRQTAAIQLVNQTLLAPHPRRPEVLYFVFGTYFQGYGTDLFRYDHATGMVSTTHNPYNEINAIAFNPADDRVMYLGLTRDAP